MPAMLKRLSLCVRENKRPAVLTLILIVFEVIIECYIPFITADFVNRIEEGADPVQILKTGLLIFFMAIVSLACGALAGYTCAKASTGFARNLRSDMLDQIQRFSFGNIDRFSSSSLVTRMTTDVSYVQMAFMMIIRIAVRSPVMFVIAIAMAYKMGGALSMTFVIVIPFLALCLFLIARSAMPAFRRVFKKYDKLNESVEENVRAMRVVKGFSREEYEKEKFGNAADTIRKDFTKAERIVALNGPVMQICLYFNMAFILLVGSKLAITSQGSALDIGQISAMVTYGVQILMSLMSLSMIYVMLTMSTESAKRICEVLTEVPTMTEPTAPVREVKDGSICFDGVSFKYSADAEQYALSDIHVHMDSGMTVGILGGTGSAKSTFVQLIPRLYDVTDGCVRVGGVDVRDYATEALREQVAMVLQKNLLFSGTIADNLRWGDPDATDEDLREACRLACADEFVMSFPQGYDTYIEQGGTNVSGGQKQRLCIARALLKKPKILILDDSTSAVDTRTDATIRHALRKYIPETTKIIIAQRVASVMDADLILVMDGGRIVAQGKHDELLRGCDIYREVYEQQTKGGASDENDADR